MKFDSDVRYLKSHEWARKDGDTVVVGISDYAQDSLGDVVFVELPEVGASVSKGDSFAVVESVKAASDIYTPVSGEVVEVNQALADNPALINEAPFGDGWLAKIKASEVSEYDAMMSASDYESYTKELED
ncbi:MAG: glycine cleavage system protein GcvH [Spirochaetaceae bacterium]|nr:MAG: glycine cleavage system protein GcvH [Spirochaetaceae bacterium]